MSFERILSDIVNESPGALGAALMGSDGIPIAQVAADGAHSDVAEDVSVLGIEFGRILEEMRKAATSVEGGTLDEVSVRMERFWTLLRAIDTETFVVVAVSPDGNVGKARFLIRRHLAAIREQL